MSYDRWWQLLVIGLFCIYPSALKAGSTGSLESTAASPVIRFTGEEAISTPAVFEIDMRLPKNKLNFAAQAGKPLTVQTGEGQQLSGIVESIEQAEGSYHVRLVSGLGRLNYRIASRTFFDKSVPDIVKAVLDEAGISGYEFRIYGSHDPRPISVQFRESDLSFICRLMQGEGIHYHFEPSADGDKVVFSDLNKGFAALASPKLNFSTKETPAISSFRRGLSMYSGTVQIGDYSWATPNNSLNGKVQSTLFKDLSDQVFPSGVEKANEASFRARILMEAQEAGARAAREPPLTGNSGPATVSRSRGVLGRISTRNT